MVPRGYKVSMPPVPGDLKGHVSRETQMTAAGEALAGAKLKNINLSVLVDGHQDATEFGDVDFTDGGIEGPLGFKVSRRFFCMTVIVLTWAGERFGCCTRLVTLLDTAVSTNLREGTCIPET